MLGVSGTQHLVTRSWPLLNILNLKHACLDSSALKCLAQGHWPRLERLDLDGNSIDATGIACLIQDRWPLLLTLTLSDEGLDAEACSLLGMTKVDVSRAGITVPGLHAPRCPPAFCCFPNLPRFPYLQLDDGPSKNGGNNPTANVLKVLMGF